MIDRLINLAGRFAIAFLAGAFAAYVYDRLEERRARARTLERIDRW